MKSTITLIIIYLTLVSCLDITVNIFATTDCSGSAASTLTIEADTCEPVLSGFV